jgi:hypothetical protein
MTASGQSGLTPVACPETPNFSYQVDDPTDDAFGSGSVLHDITAVSGEGDDTTLCLTVEFAGPVEPADAGSDHSLDGFVEFDTDEDATTGDAPIVDQLCSDSAGMGVDATLDLFTVSDGAATIFPGDENVAVSFDGNSFTAVIPLSALGGDDAFNFAMVLGTSDEPTDCAPAGSIHSPDGSVEPSS